MIRQPATLFDDTKKMMARAFYDAGQSDTEIGLAIGMPPANIADWRRREQLPENRPEPSEAVKAYMARSTANASPASPAPPSVPPPSLPPTGASSAPPASVPPRQGPTGQRRAHYAPTLVSGAGVQPDEENALEIGADGNDHPIYVDLAELLTTRLLVQGNSGSGKSHLLRKLIEETTGLVQQIVIDPEGDFITLGETFGHSIIDAAGYTPAQLMKIAQRLREHRAPAVLNLSGGTLDEQMEGAAAFLDGLFNVAPAHWHPALVFVDEAQMFAPAHNAQIDVDSNTRAASVLAMTNLMCRARKRGLCGILATQRLAKLSSNVSAEVANFLMGRTFYDNDMVRAADLLGMSKRDASQIGDLNRGEFIGVGSAIARRALKVRIGTTMTASPNAPPAITPLPTLTAGAVESIFDLPPDEQEAEAEPMPARLRAVE